MSHPLNSFSVSSGTIPVVSGSPLTYGPTDSTTNSIGVFPEAYANASTPLYAPAGSAGGGGVESVSGTAGQITVASGTTNAVVGLASVGTAGLKSNVSSITTDAQGRITASTSLAYTPANPANFVPITGGAFTGLVSGITPTADANFTTKQYVDSQIVIGGGVQSLTAGDSSITLTGTAANPIIAVSSQAGVVPGAYTNSNITVDSKGIITAVSNGAAPGDVSTWSQYPATQNVSMGSHALTNCVEVSAPANGTLDIVGSDVNIRKTASLDESSIMNIVSDVGIDIRAGGAVLVNAGGAVEIGAIGTIQILSTGNVSIGSGNALGADTEIEHISFKDNVISKYSTLLPSNPDIIIEDVDTINTVKFSADGDITTTGDIVSTGFVAGSILRLVNDAPLPDEESSLQIGTDHIISLTNNTVPEADKPALIDTVFNKPTLGISSNTLSLNAKKNDGTAVQLSSVDVSSVVPSSTFSSFPVQVERVFSDPAYQIPNTYSTVYSFKCTAGLAGFTVILPQGPAPNGSQIFLQVVPSSVGPINVKTAPGNPDSDDMIIEVGGGMYCVANNANGSLQWVISDSLYYMKLSEKYVPLTGTLPSNPMTGALVVDPTTNIESKNITTALITPLPDVGYVSVLGPTQVEGGDFLVANEPAVIGLASTATPAPGESASISYSFSVDDIVHVNKPVEAPSVIASTTLTVDGLNVKDLITFKDAHTFYVSKSGDDTTGIGSVLQPFLTIQQAITTALTSGQESVIDIGPGVFNENITIGSTSGMILQGVVQNDRCIEGTTIKGLITVNQTGQHNLTNNQIIISGLCILGKISDVSTKDHTLIVQGCRIEADNAIDEKAIEVNITANDGRTYIQDCLITQEAGSSNTNSLISCNLGFLYLVRCDLTVRSLGSVVSVSGGGAITNMSYCAITSDSTSATPNALVSIGSSTAKTHNMGLNTYVYSSSTTKLDAPAIRFITASQTCVLGNNGFSLAGTSGRNAIAFNVGCNPVLVVSNNRAVSGTANAVQSGAVISVNNYVGENAVQSITAGTGISVSGGTGATPSISNTGVLELTAGTNITITGSKSNYTISASGGSSGVSSLNSKTGALSVLGGTGITIDNTVSSEITINSTNTAVVESVVGGNGISVDSTDPANPIVSVSTTGTITTEILDVSGTGSNFSTFGVYPRVGGSYVPPTQPLELAPVQYVDDKPIGVATLNTLIGDITLSAGTNISLDTSGNTITVNNTAAAGVSSVSGTAPIVSSGGTTPAISLSASGVVANTYAYPSSLTTDTFGRITAITAGTNPSGTYLPLAGGTMSGAINMGAQQITNAGVITTTGVVAGALSLPNAGAGSGTAGITALQTDTNGAASNNLYITQTSGALSLFKPLANPVIIYSALASANLYTYLVPQFYGERHIFTGSAVSPVLNYNTNSTYTVGGNSISLNPFYCEITNGSTSTLTVKVRYPNGGIPPATYPPLSTAPTTIAPSGTWADQTILPVGLVGTTTPTIASGGTKRLFFNGTSWYLI